MEVLTQTEVREHQNEIIEKIQNGALFIYPTDTIYGIGCNAQDEQAVAKIRELKGRFDQPFSVIVPSIDWIRENCVITKKTESWLQKLPGPFTLILKLKNESAVAQNVAPDMKTIGVRFINHWFMNIINKCDVPIITTSANKSGEFFMTSIKNLDKDIENNVDFIIYEGENKGSPSKIVNVEKVEVMER